MATVHILKTRAKSSFATFEFASYNEARAYANKCAALTPSKPYKRVLPAGAPVWCVTLRQPRNDRAEYVTFRETPGYLGWPLAA